jgi:hypothetical protein
MTLQQIDLSSHTAGIATIQHISHSWSKNLQAALALLVQQADSVPPALFRQLDSKSWKSLQAQTNCRILAQDLVHVRVLQLTSKSPELGFVREFCDLVEATEAPRQVGSDGVQNSTCAASRAIADNL